MRISNTKGNFMRRVSVLILFGILLFPVAISAQDPVFAAPPQYTLGSQMFTFRAGPVLPLFSYYYNIDEFKNSEEMNMKVGGYGSIRYQGFINESVAIGGELGYYFAYSASDLFTSVPFEAKLTYIPLQGTIEIPLSLGLGFAYNSYNISSKLTFFASAEVGLSWYFTPDWGVNISAGYWLIPEIYLDKSTSQWNDATLANFMPITLSIIYRN